MDQRRLIAFLIFSFAVVMLWDAWVSDQRRSAEPVPQVTAQAGAPAASDDGAVPVPSSDLSPSAGEPGAVPQAVAPATPLSQRRVTVETDMVRAEISAEGGQIVRMELKRHAASDDRSRNFVLFDDGMRHVYAAQGGLIGDGLPNHRTPYALPEGELTLPEGQDTLEVRLRALDTRGAEVTKVLTFTRGSYVVDVRYEITNRSERPLSAHAYFQFARDGQPAEAVQVFGVSTFTGPAVYITESKYQKVQFEENDEGKAKFVTRSSDGWLAMVQHYFVAAWLPAEGQPRENYMRRIAPDRYTAGVIMPVQAIAPQETGTVSTRLYA